MPANQLLPILLAVFIAVGPSSVQPAPATATAPPMDAPPETVSTRPDQADTTAGSRHSTDDRLAETGAVLFLFLVLSLVLESAMSVIFDWRIFIRHFEGRGVKTPVVVGTAFLLFLKYDLDIIYDLLVALGRDASPSIVGTFLTALLVAGGSGGIFRIFSRLGIRSPAERKRKAKEERASDSSSSSST